MNTFESSFKINHGGKKSKQVGRKVNNALFH